MPRVRATESSRRAAATLGAQYGAGRASDSWKNPNTGDDVRPLTVRGDRRDPEICSSRPRDGCSRRATTASRSMPATAIFSSSFSRRASISAPINMAARSTIARGFCLRRWRGQGGVAAIFRWSCVCPRANSSRAVTAGRISSSSRDGSSARASRRSIFRAAATRVRSFRSTAYSRRLFRAVALDRMRSRSSRR